MAIIEDRRGQVLLLIAVVFIVVMDGMDASIVNIALPHIASSFEVDTSTAAWVTLTYFMMMAGLLLAFGRLADRGRTRRILIGGLATFIVFSLVCGLAPTFEVLLAGRILQGVGAAVMGACAPLMCVRYLPASRLGVSMGTIGFGASIGYASGPALGGFIAQYLSWPWIFIINVPIGLAGMLFLLLAVPREGAGERRRFDVPGSVLSTVAIITAVFAVERSAHLGVGNVQIIAAALLCIGSTALFLAWERRCPEPLVNLSIFRRWRFDAVFLAFMLINLVGTGMWYLTPFYLSLGAGLDAASSGLYMLIQPALTLALAIPIGRWSDHIGRRWFSVTSCTAMALSCAVLYIIDPSMGPAPLLAALVLMGLLWAFCGPGASRIVDNISEHDKGTGATLIALATYLGASMGAALFASSFTFLSGAGDVPFAELDLLTFLGGFRGTMLLGLALSVLAVALSLAVRERRPTP